MKYWKPYLNIPPKNSKSILFEHKNKYLKKNFLYSILSAPSISQGKKMFGKVHLFHC